MPADRPAPESALTLAAPIPPGRVDIHSHLLPGIDDGCRDFAESLECVNRLIAAGYVGTICTPHIYPEMFPANRIDAIRRWVANLQRRIDDAGLQYRLWAGGEVRLAEDTVEWIRDNGAPTLGESHCILGDFWGAVWPSWATRVLEGLLAEGYQPILAHPERMICARSTPQCLDALMRMGVWLQGNFRSFTGGEGPLANEICRELLHAGSYRLLALDMHRPDSLESRFDGMRLVQQEFGRDTLDRLTIDAPRVIVASA